MTKLLMSVAASALLLGVASASAADMMEPVAPSYAPAMEAFSGFYAGVDIGLVNQSGEVADFGPNYSTSAGWQDATSASGFLLGAAIGYDFRLSDNIVVGVALDAKSVFSETSFCSDSDCNEGPDDVHLGFEIGGLIAATGRVGFIVNDSMMLYALAGPAGAMVRTHHWDNDDYDNTNRMFTGYTVGIGAEAMVSENVSMGVEGRYYSFNEQSWTDNADEDFGAAPEAFTVSVSAKLHF